MVMIHTHTKRSVGLKADVKQQTDGWTDTTVCSTWPANAVGRNTCNNKRRRRRSGATVARFLRTILLLLSYRYDVYSHGTYGILSLLHSVVSVESFAVSSVNADYN